MEIAVGEMTPDRVVELVLGQNARLRTRSSPRRSTGRSRLRPTWRGRDRSCVAPRRLAGSRPAERLRGERRARHGGSRRRGARESSLPARRGGRACGTAARASCRGWDRRPGDLGRGVGGGRRRLEVDLEEQGRRRRPRGERHRGGRNAVVTDQRERARIEVLDRGDVDAVRSPVRRGRVPAWRRSSASASAAASSPTRRQADEPRGRRRQHDELDRRDDAERAFGADEEIDEVHARRRRNTRRRASARPACDSVGIAIRGSRRRRRRSRSRRSGLAVDVAALEIEDVAVGEHDGERADPAAGCAVLERRRAGGVGRDGAADRRAIVGGERRDSIGRARRGASRELGERRRPAPTTTDVGRGGPIAAQTRGREQRSHRAVSRRRSGRTARRSTRTRSARASTAATPPRSRESRRRVCGRRERARRRSEARRARRRSLVRTIGPEGAARRPARTTARERMRPSG